jgi:hypothetical protein
MKPIIDPRDGDIEESCWQPRDGGCASANELRKLLRLGADRSDELKLIGHISLLKPCSAPTSTNP